MAKTDSQPTNQLREWTLMFYMASDNPLAPAVVSQLKAIKSAGYHPEANVLVQFDPCTEGTPTHIFDVNLINKLKKPGKTKIGFTGFGPSDPFIVDMLEDKLWRDQTDRHGKVTIRERIRANLPSYDPPMPPQIELGLAQESKTKNECDTPDKSKEPDPEKSLRAFLTFCRKHYPARHYMLFILGHGVVVGNDVFLYDEHADKHSLSLRELGRLLKEFRNKISKDADFELVGFHSCSMSSLEVAYELKGTAKYMLASQGPAFVGSWPYRQILMRVFLDLKKKGSRIDVKTMLKRIFYYCLHNSTDYLVAGYSFDLSLCSLNPDIVTAIRRPLEELSTALSTALPDPQDLDAAKKQIKEILLLAHWESQSYWQESYTDLFDFCFCLSRRCRGFENDEGQLGEYKRRIFNASEALMSQLRKEQRQEDGKLVVRSEFAGPAYQYSHGLSVFFPWAKPSEDSNILKEYKCYKFKDTTWLSFLSKYFDSTQRHTLREELSLPPQNPEEELREDIASLVYNDEGQLSSGNSLAPPADKVDPRDKTGDDCHCPTIKNFPRDTRPRRQRGRRAFGIAVPTSDTFFEDR